MHTSRDHLAILGIPHTDFFWVELFPELRLITLGLYRLLAFTNTKRIGEPLMKQGCCSGRIITFIEKSNIISDSSISKVFVLRKHDKISHRFSSGNPLVPRFSRAYDLSQQSSSNVFFRFARVHAKQRKCIHLPSTFLRSTGAYTIGRPSFPTESSWGGSTWYSCISYSRTGSTVSR